MEDLGPNKLHYFESGYTIIVEKSVKPDGEDFIMYYKKNDNGIGKLKLESNINDLGLHVEKLENKTYKDDINSTEKIKLFQR